MSIISIIHDRKSLTGKDKFRMKANRKKLLFEKVMSRDCSVIMARVWQNYFFATGKQTLNIWPKLIFIFRNGITESWRPTSLFFGKVPKAISEWIRESNQNRKKIFILIKRYQVYSKKIKKFDTNAKTAKGAIARIKKVIKYSDLAGPGLIMGYWIQYWHRERKIADFPEDICRKGGEIRKKDALFDDGSEAIYRLLKNLSKKLAMPYSYLKLLTLKELEFYVQNTESRRIAEVVKKRQNSYFMHGFTIHDFHELKSYLRKNRLKLVEEKYSRANELWGQVANAGKAVGRVKVILNREQAGKLKKGDILVAAMTTPWYIPIMKKAAAYVTDEGGVMCHAAVIAREFHKPCVVGTKFATKIFKDGDLVEVDAGRGIVKKL